MNDRRFIFQDASGRRWPLFKTLVVIATLLAAVASAFFVYSLVIPAIFDNPQSLASLKKQLRKMAHREAPRRANTNQKVLQQFLAARSRPTVSPTPHPPKLVPGGIRAAFFSGWDKASLDSLARNAAVITHLCPEWLRLVRLDGRLEEEEDSGIEEIPANRSYELLPLLTNLDGSERVPEGVENLASSPSSDRARFVRDLAARLKKVGAAGVVLDWEDIDPGLQEELTVFVEEIAAGLKNGGMKTWLCVTTDAGFAAFDIKRLSPVVDHFVALLHDENGEQDSPGPVASQDWFEGWVQVALDSAPAEKWIASIGAYGYDWKEGTPNAEQISFADAMSRAGNAGADEVAVKAPSFNGTFSYFVGGEGHEVWFLDATSFLNQLQTVRDNHLGGFAINRIGLEDPGVWKVVTAAVRPDGDIRSALLSLKKIPGGNAITSIASGEVVSLDPTVGDGTRLFETVPDERVQSNYKVLPAYPTLFRAGGGSGHRVVLTFDDGPDPEWTPKILDILKAYRVKATFFILGREAEDHAELVRRIAEEGHEIGNHSFLHPNLAEVSDARIRLELNATQRLIESLTGHSTTLFRPPYDADSSPSDLAELEPIRVAQSLGYLTVLENIDPCDWQRPGVDNILQRIKDQRPRGTIILLHDGGGNRAQTVAALPRLLDYLKERGDQVVSVADLLGLSHGQVMPSVTSGNKSVLFMASGTGFVLLRALRGFFLTFLFVATILVAVRTVLVLFLAWFHSRQVPPPAGFCPPVTVIVPAFNEGRVIEKTLDSILASEYAGAIEVLVVDDGSSDDTTARVLAMKSAQVRLIRQPNSGKAHALQHGVNEARHAYLIFMDADTVFDPAAIRHLLEPFCDNEVGAVSGHARVGNPRRAIARFQDLEYICGFNLDRRAYALWDCITVVPGAISALRKSAIIAAGGFSYETLAEDTDITLSIHRAGYKVAYQSSAVAYTEAPETIPSLAKQRFRWAYGTLQCAWKHRDIVFNPRYKALGWFSLPGIWFFQVVLVACSPFIDLLFLQSLLIGNEMEVLPFFIVFLLSDLLLAGFAVRLEGLPLSRALWIIPQRFVYRPLLSYVIWKSILHAMRGALVGWGKLHRTATVSLP